ncbi:MAG: hypothetical protein A2Z14_18140 [Chloroflexi bacterium RBG_16_48_8]|nr:MAG: hypothetical protein A2Z14_18140 [Chloroflexi bacterium RBG_16_48_8]
MIRLSSFDVSTPEGREKERYRRIVLNTIASVFARISTAIVSLAIIPMLLTYLDKQLFGMWTTITVTVTWFTLFDFGIINGLVNAISEAYGRDDREIASGYVSTALIVLVMISVLTSIIAVLLAPHINWNQVFAISDNIETERVRLIVLSASLPVLIGMPFSIVRQIYAGYQKSYVGHLFSIVGSMITILAVYFAIHLQLELHYITAVLIGIPILFAGINLVYIFGVEMPWLRPRLSRIRISSLKRLLRTSIPLFLFQIGALLVNQTQPIILAHRSGLEEVTEYTIVIRLYQAFMSLITVSTIAFVPPFREASERGDHAWVSVGFRKMLSIRMILAILFSFMMALFGNFLVGKWLGRTDIVFSLAVWIVLSVMLVSSTWSTAFSDLLVIMEKIWIQVVLVLFNGVSILALTYLLSPSIGVMGALIASNGFTFLVLSWLLPRISRSLLVADVYL